MQKTEKVDIDYHFMRTTVLERAYADVLAIIGQYEKKTHTTVKVEKQKVMVIAEEIMAKEIALIGKKIEQLEEVKCT